MTLIYLSEDKIIGSFTAALIAENFTNNLDKSIPLDNKYHTLTIAFDVLKHLANKEIIDQKYLLNICKNLTINQLAIAFFPLILYNYQNPEKLEQYLTILMDNYSYFKMNKDSINIFIIIVNLILSKKLNFKKITPQILPYLEKKNEETISYLQLIDKMIIDSQPLTTVNNIFSSKITKNHLAVYQSLYCFFCNFYNVKNSLLRSTYFLYESKPTAILNGYLLGLYNGYFDIPYSWRESPQVSAKIQEIEILTQKLIAYWQGKMDN